MNLAFAGAALAGGAVLLRRQPSPAGPRLDIPGVLLASCGVFCLVYGFSNAAAHSWRTPSTLGFTAAGVVALAVLAAWRARAARPLLPPRVVLDRNRGGAHLSMFLPGAGLFGAFLLWSYYLQQMLGYSPLVTGVAFLPFAVSTGLASNLAAIVVMPRTGPRPVAASGMLAVAGAMAWLAQLGPHAGYAAGALGPFILAGLGMGMVISTAISTGTFGVAPQDAGVASATVTVGQQLGFSIGTSLLNTIFAGAVTSHLAAHLGSPGLSAARPSPGWRWRTATTPRSGGPLASSRMIRRFLTKVDDQSHCSGGPASSNTARATTGGCAGAQPPLDPETRLYPPRSSRRCGSWRYSAFDQGTKGIVAVGHDLGRGLDRGQEEVAQHLQRDTAL